MTDQTEVISKLQIGFIEVGKQLAILDGAIGELRASVNVLKVFTALQLSPGDPLEGLKQLRSSEQIVADISDPNAKDRDHLLEASSALQDWIKRGRPSHDS